VEIDAGTYLGHGSCPGAQALWAANGLTIVGVGGPVILDANGNSVQGKGIWLVTGNNTTIDGITFQCEVYSKIPECGDYVQDSPGSGLRLEGVGLTVRNSVFRWNDDGILSSNVQSGTINIQGSEFVSNGHGINGGTTHNVYVNADTLIFRGNYSHQSVLGHTLKTRARNNYIEYNRFMDEATGTGSFLIDIPNGGLSYVIGNLLEKGPLGDNNVPIRYAEEGSNVVTNLVQELYVVNNTMVNDTGGSINYVSAVGTPTVLVRNNIAWGTGTVLSCSGCRSTVDHNVTADPKFVNQGAYDYHLANGSPATDAGIDPGSAHGYALTRTLQYVYDLQTTTRTVIGQLDAGALEGAAGTAPPPPVLLP
jgi:hypothetical protein